MKSIRTIIFITLVFLIIPVQISVAASESDFLMNGSYLYEYDGNDKVVRIPEKIGGQTVTRIDDYCFSSTDIEEVYIPECVQVIGAGAFFDCSSLMTIHFSEGLREIGEYAFYGTGLTEADLPASLVSIDQYAFGYCYQLTSVKLANDNADISGNAFDHCTVVNFIYENTSDHESADKEKTVDTDIGNVNASDNSVNNSAPEPTFLSEPVNRLNGSITVPVKAKQKLNVYAYCGTKSADNPNVTAYKLGQIITGETINIFGRESGWLLVDTVNTKGEHICGYISADKTKGLDQSQIQYLELSNEYAGICRNTSMYASPDPYSKKIIEDLPFGSEACYLATASEDWAYVEIRIKYKLYRGFVPLNDVLIRNGQKVKIIRTSSSNHVDPKGDVNFDASRMIDGNRNTSWQFKTTAGLNNIHAEFDFSAPLSLERMVIYNGYWKRSNNQDQYRSNGRMTEMEVSFLYEGDTDYTDAIRVLLPEISDWSKRNDGYYIDLRGHDRVTGVRIRPIQVKKGTKYQNDAAVSEVEFYTR